MFLLVLRTTGCCVAWENLHRVCQCIEGVGVAYLLFRYQAVVLVVYSHV